MLMGYMVIYDDLVGGLEHEFHDFPSIGNVIIPTDFNSTIFQRGRYTTNQINTRILDYQRV